MGGWLWWVDGVGGWIEWVDRMTHNDQDNPLLRTYGDEST